MCFIVMHQTPIRRLLGAAQNVQRLLDDGTLPAAFGNADSNAAQTSVAAFDQLADSAVLVAVEQKAVSPFLRYRREILDDTLIGHRLRELVMNFKGGVACDLAATLEAADDYHKRVTLDLIAAYANRGENDQHFMALANEIAEAKSSEVSA